LFRAKGIGLAGQRAGGYIEATGRSICVPHTCRTGFLARPGSASIMLKSRRHYLEYDGASYFVTFRLACRNAADLADGTIAPIIIRALHHFDGERYLLYDYTVMPDHVHLIVKPLPYDGRVQPVGRIMQSIKGWTARQINQLLGRRGPLWQAGRYDRIIRNRHDYEETARYIWTNPVAGGFVEAAELWPWSGTGRALSEAS